MATYPHTGPGPSSYYQPSPPPHHGYGNHSPGPRPNYYPYPAPPPPPAHMNSHPTGQYHHPTPSRGSHRGGHINGSYSSRGTHHYHHGYQPQQTFNHVTPPLGHHPHAPHAGPHPPYSPQRQQPYSPSYHYPSPTAPVFTPSWQTQQPISPLPKQLSMPPPQNIQAFYEPTTQSQSPATFQPTDEVPSSTEIEPPTPDEVSSSTEAPAPEEAPEPSDEVIESTEEPPVSEPSLDTTSSTEEVHSSPPTPPIPSSSIQTTSYSQMGTINTSDASTQPSSSPTMSNPVAHWAIWSRRPQNPSQAPGIIISPRARPPADIVHQALDLKTPPPSRPATPLPLIIVEPSTVPEKDSSPSSDELVANAWSSQSNSTAPSSSATESADTPVVPGSPASSHTSLSVTKESREISTESSEADTIHSTPTESASTAPETSSTPVPAAFVPSVSIQDTFTTSTSEMSTTSVVTLPPQPAPTIPAVPAPKKSWASLLRPATSATPAPGPSRNALPTSSVVGFSIPATTPENPSVPVSPSNKSELVNLLTTGPTAATGTGFAAAASGATTAATLKIRPRGLVNSGNMCFANSVLQILVYCPPFHKLFSELGKLLVGPVVGGHGKEDANKIPASGSTPLVDATAAFLQEFVQDKRKTRKIEVVSRNGVNGSSGSGRSGKGKEREIKEDRMEDDDWDGDSFLPGYVYDAMKAKKRFDNMRGGHQEDAEEFFGFYLDTLEEELLSILSSLTPPRQNKSGSSDAAVEEQEEAAPPEDDGWLEVGRRNRTVVTRTIKAAESPITRIFGGKFRSTLRASGQKDSVIVEDWRSLRLDIQRDQIHTIQDALSCISHPQPVQVSLPNKTTVEAQQQVLIEALPPVLVLHLKRFCYDVATNGVVKVGKHVRFGPELEIGPDIMVPAAKKSQPARYKLFGAVYHHGLSAGGGHYTLDVLHPNRYPNSLPNAAPREGWVRIDDELVSDVRPEDVFNAHERDDQRCAYLLFYRRV